MLVGRVEMEFSEELVRISWCSDEEERAGSILQILDTALSEIGSYQMK